MRPISFIVSRTIHTMSNLDNFIQQVWPVKSLLANSTILLFKKIYILHKHVRNINDARGQKLLIIHDQGSQK